MRRLVALRHRLIDLTAGAALALLASCSSSVANEPTVSLASTSTHDEPGSLDSESLEEVVIDAVGGHSGGVDVLRRLDGETVNITAGVADADGTKLTTGRPFRIGSLTKTFVATIVMQLVDEGRVDLDQPLDTYLPSAAVGGSVTVRQLLSHRSGLPNYTAAPEFAEVFIDLDRWFTPDDILGFVAAESAESPGRFEYANTNFILIGQLIEAVDGRPLAESLRLRIIEVLGLTSTFLPTEADPLAVMPVGAWEVGLLDGQPDGPYDSIVSSAWAAGAMISSSEDLLVFLDALFGGKLMSSESLAQMVDVQPDGATPGSGYGLGIMTIGVEGISGFGHNGGIPGFTSMMVYDPNSGDVFIGLKNNPEIDTLPIQRRAGRP